MSNYIELATLRYPVHEGDIRLAHPEIGPVFSCPETYALVELTDIPFVDDTKQEVFHCPPINTNGVWRTVWGIRDLTPEEIEYKRILDEKFNPKGKQNLETAGSTPDVIG